jgi:hypothetical protein
MTLSTVVMEALAGGHFGQVAATVLALPRTVADEPKDGMFRSGAVPWRINNEERGGSDDAKYVGPGRQSDLRDAGG